VARILRLSAVVRRNPLLERKLASLRRTINAERQLLAHPLFSIGAARVMVQARADLRRLDNRRTAR
jgi:hypothetical protein